MRGIFSLTKIAFISTCIFGLSIAQPDEFQTLNTIEEFGGKAWNQAQTVFQNTADKMKQVFRDDIEKYTIFKHESFSNYALRYRTPSICDPNVKQV